MNQRIGVAIVDDQELVRLGIASILEDENDIDVVLSNGDPANALCMLQERNGAGVLVALIDSRMPGMSGADFIAHLVRIRPDISCIMLTAFDEDKSLVDCIRSGGKGHLLKDASGDEIVAAVRTVAAGGMAFGPHETARMARLLTEQKPDISVQSSGTASCDVLEELSEEDRHIAHLTAEGRTNREIARELCFAPGTIRNRLTVIFARLGVRNRTELAALLHD